MRENVRRISGLFDIADVPITVITIQIAAKRFMQFLYIESCRHENGLFSSHKNSEYCKWNDALLYDS